MTKTPPTGHAQVPVFASLAEFNSLRFYTRSLDGFGHELQYRVEQLHRPGIILQRLTKAAYDFDNFVAELQRHVAKQDFRDFQPDHSRLAEAQQQIEVLATLSNRFEQQNKYGNQRDQASRNIEALTKRAQELLATALREQEGINERLGRLAVHPSTDIPPAFTDAFDNSV